MRQFWLFLALPFLILQISGFGCQESSPFGTSIALPNGSDLSVRYGPHTDFPCHVETITLVNTSDNVINLEGWRFMGQDLSGRIFRPGDEIMLRDVPGQSGDRTIYTGGDGRGFNQGGVFLVDPGGNYHGTGMTCSFAH